MPSFTTAVVAFAATLAVVSNPQAVDAQEQCGKSIIIEGGLIQARGLTLGSLYDAENSRALGGKFWGENKIAENLFKLHDSSELTKVSIVNNRADRRKLVGITAEIGIEMEMAGGISVAGSGKVAFANHARAKIGTTVLAMSVERRTQTHVIGEKLIQKLVTSSMHFGGEATHVVTRVDYGASVTANFEYFEDTQEAADNLVVSAELKVTKADVFEVEGSFALNIGSSENTSLVGASVTLNSDIPLTTEGVDYESGIQAITEFDQAFNKINSYEREDGEVIGLGVPVSFQLMPICFWESDKAGRFLRELNAKTLNELMLLFDSFYDVEARARAMGKEAAVNGLPTLLYQTEDLGLAVSQFFGRMRVGFVQILPKIRAGTLGETEIIDFMEGIKNSPFAPFAVNRWMDGALEMITLQKQIRGWIIRNSEADSVTLVKTFSDLQQFLRSPAVDTVVAFAHVGKPNGLSTHLKTMQTYLKDAVPEGYNGLFETNKFLQNVENTVRTRNAMELLRRFAEPGTNVCALAGCVWKRQKMVFMDYQSYKDELTAMGASLDTSSLMLWQRGLLVNAEYKDCVSLTDPRDHLTGKCLWSGQNDIPDGNRCSADLNDESRGCSSSCSSDGYCRATECPRYEILRSFVFLGRRKHAPFVNGESFVTEGYGEIPSHFFLRDADADHAGETAYDDNVGFPGIVSIRAQSTDTATTIFATLSDTVYEVKDEVTSDFTYPHQDRLLQNPGRWRWVSPGLIMSEEFENMCLQVIRSLKDDKKTFDYSQISLRPCNKYVDYQIWEVSTEWGLPKFKILRPNKSIEDKNDYCLTVQWGAAVDGSESSVQMAECAEANADQSFFEGFQLGVSDKKVKFDDTPAAKDAAGSWIKEDLETSLVLMEEQTDTFFFWRNDKLSTFGIGSDEAYVLQEDQYANEAENIAVEGLDQALAFLKPSNVVPLFTPRDAQISKFGGLGCLEAGDSATANKTGLLRLRECNTQNRNQDVYDCNVQTCEPETCKAYGGNDVSFCVASSAPGSSGPQCYCKPGYGQVGSELACVDIIACDTAACDLEDYCIDFPPPAPDGASGRACVPRTGCDKGFHASGFPARADIECTACKDGFFQNQNAFFGEECTPVSAECEEGESMELESTKVNDISCKDCSKTLCKEVEVAPPQTSAQASIDAKNTKGFAGMGSVEITDNGDPALTSFVDEPMPWYILSGVAMFLLVVMLWFLKRKCCGSKGRGGGKEGKKATKPKRQTKKEKKAALAGAKNGELSPGQLGVQNNDPSGGLGAQRSPGGQDPGFGVSMGGPPSGNLDV